MLISDKHQFIFVHVSKAAGSSIHRTLEPFANHNNKSKLNKVLSKTGLKRDYQSRYFAQHAYISEAMKYMPEEIFKSYFKFGFVRNPWDWIVSMYSFLQQNTSHRHNAKIRVMNFSEYVDFEISRNQRFQHSFLCDDAGELAVDFVGRFEQLSDDFNHICNQVNLEVELPHFNASKRKDYRDYYDTNTVDKVASHWHKDIALFKYSFE